jgi:ankyrin repeat protein
MISSCDPIKSIGSDCHFNLQSNKNDASDECKSNALNNFFKLLEERKVGIPVSDDNACPFFGAVISNKHDKILQFVNNKTDLDCMDYWGNNLLISLSLSCNIDSLLDIVNNNLNDFSNKTIYDFFVHLMTSSLLPYSNEYADNIKRTLIEKCDKKLFNQKDAFENTIIVHCLSNSERLEQLLDICDVNLEETNLYGNNPVLTCIQYGSCESLRVLLKYIKRTYTNEQRTKILNHQNMSMQTPLSLAVGMKNTKMVNSLLDTNAVDYNYVNDDGKNILLLTIDNKLENVYNKLLDFSDINYNIEDNFNNTPLSTAIDINDFSLVKKLLTMKSDITCKDTINRTPLINLLLLRYNSGPSVERHFDMVKNEPSPTDIFASIGCAPVKSSCDGIQIPKDPYKSEYARKLNKFLSDIVINTIIKSSDAELNESDICGNTVFKLICDNNDTMLFNILMSMKNFDPKVKDIDNQSAYEYIKQKYQTNMSKIFGNRNYCANDVVHLDEQLDVVDVVDDENIVNIFDKQLDNVFDVNDMDDTDDMDDDIENISNTSSTTPNNFDKLQNMIKETIKNEISSHVKQLKEQPVQPSQPAPVQPANQYKGTLNMPDMGYTDTPLTKLPKRPPNEVEIKMIKTLTYFYKKTYELVNKKHTNQRAKKID